MTGGQSLRWELRGNRVALLRRAPVAAAPTGARADAVNAGTEFNFRRNAVFAIADRSATAAEIARETKLSARELEMLRSLRA